MNISLSELAQNAEHLISGALAHPGPTAIGFVFAGGLLTSLGPCSISLLPITLAYLAGFNNNQGPLIRSLLFCSGIVISLVLLGGISGFLGSIYGQIPLLIPTLVAVLAIFMGLNLLGIIKLPLPVGPDPNHWSKSVPKSLAPISAGLAFGLASTPCTTPVLAVLLGSIAQNGSPLIGVILLASFGIGQVIPLLLAGTAAASISNLLAIRSFSYWIPAISGVILITSGLLTLIARWI